MSKIPTAEEFLIRQGCVRMDCEGEDCDFFEDVQPKDLIEFAKLHLIEAQEAWFDKIKSEGLVTEAGIAYLENAYPIDNIK